MEFFRQHNLKGGSTSKVVVHPRLSQYYIYTYIVKTGKGIVPPLQFKSRLWLNIEHSASSKWESSAAEGENEETTSGDIKSLLTKYAKIKFEYTIYLGSTAHLGTFAKKGSINL